MSERSRRMFNWNAATGMVFFFATLLLYSGPAAAQQEHTDSPGTVSKLPLTADEIIRRLQERNHEREEALRELTGTRVYRVQYHGFFGTREAEAVIRYRYASPNTREFTVLSQSGSKFLIDHVITGLLNGEKEAANKDNRQRTALSAANYNFTLADNDSDGDESQYVLSVIPKTDNKFLYRGKIWIDGNDFAVTRIEAEPAKSPSFWVRRSEVHHRYKKVADFWLPAENTTDSSIRMGGHALLSIEYKDYEIIGAVRPDPAEHPGDNSSAPVTTLKIMVFH
jgi:hypothetical protein